MHVQNTHVRINYSSNLQLSLFTYAFTYVCLKVEKEEAYVYLKDVRIILMWKFDLSYFAFMSPFFFTIYSCSTVIHFYNFICLRCTTKGTYNPYESNHLKILWSVRIVLESFFWCCHRFYAKNCYEKQKHIV